LGERINTQQLRPAQIQLRITRPRRGAERLRNYGKDLRSAKWGCSAHFIRLAADPSAGTEQFFGVFLGFPADVRSGSTATE
jgi:hypothetical protein